MVRPRHQPSSGKVAVGAAEGGSSGTKRRPKPNSVAHQASEFESSETPGSFASPRPSCANLRLHNSLRSSCSARYLFGDIVSRPRSASTW